MKPIAGQAIFDQQLKWPVLSCSTVESWPPALSGWNYGQQVPSLVVAGVWSRASVVRARLINSDLTRAAIAAINTWPFINLFVRTFVRLPFPPQVCLPQGELLSPYFFGQSGKKTGTDSELIDSSLGLGRVSLMRRQADVFSFSIWSEPCSRSFNSFSDWFRPTERISCLRLVWAEI